MESHEQKAVVMYCDIKGIPIIHIPNEGKRSPRQGKELKEMGLRRGVPDLFLFRACGRFHGLWIEMKWGKNKLTREQEECLYRLSSEGYAVKVCYTATEAIKAIERYISLGGQEQ